MTKEEADLKVAVDGLDNIKKSQNWFFSDNDVVNLRVLIDHAKKSIPQPKSKRWVVQWASDHFQKSNLAEPHIAVLTSLNEVYTLVHDLTNEGHTVSVWMSS